MNFSQHVSSSCLKIKLDTKQEAPGHRIETAVYAHSQYIRTSNFRVIAAIFGEYVQVLTVDVDPGATDANAVGQVFRKGISQTGQTEA